MTLLKTSSYGGLGVYKHDGEIVVIEYAKNSIAYPGYLYDGKALFSAIIDV